MAGPCACNGGRRKGANQNGAGEAELRRQVRSQAGAWVRGGESRASKTSCVSKLELGYEGWGGSWRAVLPSPPGGAWLRCESGDSKTSTLELGYEGGYR